MLTKNQRAEVRIESCTPEGYGVCRMEGRAVFVASAMAGERWEILILKVTASAVWAKGLRLLEPSAFRCEPDCRNLCGGCTLRHMAYVEELRVKREHVDDCLCRLGKQAAGTSAIHPSPLTARYRNKAIFAVDTVAGKPAFGFYRPRTHTLVPVRDCLLQSEESLRAARSHFGLGGLSNGALFTYEGGMQYNFDLFGSYFAFSGNSEPWKTIAAIQKDEFAKLPVDCLFTGSGSLNDWQQNYTKIGFEYFVEKDDRFVEGENAWRVDVEGGHEWKVWYTCLYNAMQVMFQEV